MLRKWFGRAFYELPDKAESNQTGVAFVGLMFGIAVSAGATGVSEPLIDIFKPMGEQENGQSAVLFENRIATIMHYMVAFALSVSSFIGYYTSNNVPQLKIRFFNFPFAQFCLDISMVISYFVLFLFAEGPQDQPDARPEASLVAISFVLYVTWDMLSWRLKCDPLSQLALGARPYENSGFFESLENRRIVTIGFATFMALFAVYVEKFRTPTSTVGVVVVDLILILFIMLFRLAKSFGDDDIKYRDQSLDPVATTALKPLYASKYKSLAKTDWSRVVPSSVSRDFNLLEAVAKKGTLNIEAQHGARTDAAKRLERDGAIELRYESPNLSVASLTEAGKAYVSMAWIAK